MVATGVAGVPGFMGIGSCSVFGVRCSGILGISYREYWEHRIVDIVSWISYRECHMYLMNTVNAINPMNYL